MYIKGFNKDLQCVVDGKVTQYEIGKIYDTGYTENLKLCSKTVIHFCDSIQKVHNYYRCGYNNRFCEIEVLGELVHDDVKCGSNMIRIIREITGEELETLIGHTNGNIGLFNTGNKNTGSWNTGGYNIGNCNTGGWNTGGWNTGDRNTCNCNSGDWNTGGWNTGDRNTGDWNSGSCNTGNRNTGNRNTGNYNTGYWNSCNYSAGFFCTEEPKAIIFNKQTDMTISEFKNSKFYDALMSSNFELTKWVMYTEEEMENDVEKRYTGGYLKSYTYEEACKNWWDNMSDENKEIVMSIPNFDKEIFKEITGIEL